MDPYPVSTYRVDTNTRKTDVMYDPFSEWTVTKNNNNPDIISTLARNVLHDIISRIHPVTIREANVRHLSKIVQLIGFNEGKSKQWKRRGQLIGIKAMKAPEITNRLFEGNQSIENAADNTFFVSSSCDCEPSFIYSYESTRNSPE